MNRSETNGPRLVLRGRRPATASLRAWAGVVAIGFTSVIIGILANRAFEDPLLSVMIAGLASVIVVGFLHAFGLLSNQ